MANDGRAWLKHLARGLLSVALFAFALYHVDWSGVKGLLLRIDGLWLVLHLLTLAVERFVFSFKWQVLLKAKDLLVPLWSLILITLIGKFWGLFLPSSVSVDVVRGYYLYRRTSSGTLAASSLIVDKVMSLWALLLMGLVGLLSYGSVFGNVDIGLYLAALIGFTGAFLYVAQRSDFARWLERTAPRLLGEKLSGLVVKVYRSFLGYKQLPGTLVYSFFLSLLLQLVRVLGVFTMARALHIEIPVVYYFVMIPIAMILIMLPISIGGFGLREGIFVALFALAGMSTTDAFALGFAISITDLFVSLVGGAAYLTERPVRHEES